MPKSSTIPEFAAVVLIKPFQAFDESFPKGTTGTIVSVYAGGEAYAVEFDGPEQSVVEVPADYLMSRPEAADSINPSSPPTVRRGG